LAARNGRGNIVRLLLENGANIDGLQIERETTLHLAASNGHENMVGLLLDKGANVDGKNDDGSTALHLAAKGGHEDVVKLLLDKVANIDDKNNDGDTALHLAASSGHVNIVNLLLSRGANSNEKNNKDETPLDLARSKGRSVVVRILERWLSAPPKSLTVQKGASAAMPISPDFKNLVEALGEVARKLVVPSINLLKQMIRPENVVDIAALLAGHNIVLIALRGGLLEKPYSTLDDDPDWFKNQLYSPICDKVKSKEEQDLVMKIMNQAESLGIIRNAEDIRQSIAINEKINRRIQTIGSVIVDLYQRINKVDAGTRDVAQHNKSIGLALKQFYLAYQKNSKIDRVSSLLRLSISIIPFVATAVEKPVEMGLELLLMEIDEVMNRDNGEFTNFDLTDFRVAKWIVSERFQKYLPKHARASFEMEAQKSFGGMLKLQGSVYEMMKDSNVTPLILQEEGTK